MSSVLIKLRVFQIAETKTIIKMQKNPDYLTFFFILNFNAIDMY